MSIGTQRGTFQIPTFEEIMAQMEQFDVTPEFIEALTNYALLTRLQTDLGQVGVQQGQIGLQQEEIDFARNYEMPYKRDKLENDRLLAELGLQSRQTEYETQKALAELGLESRQVDLLSQRELADIRAKQQEQELIQLRERGQYNTFQNDIARKTALINLAMQREQLAASKGYNRRGQGQFSSRSVY